MKSAKLNPSGFFVIRTPLLPINELVAWSDGLAAPQALRNSEDLTQALESDRRLLSDRLLATFDRPEVREALFVASPSLFERRGELITDPHGKRGRKAAKGLVSYFGRMTARPTPFGLFAGTSVGDVARDTKVDLAPRAAYRRHTRFDMDYLSRLADGLIKDSTLRHQIPCRPNNGLYRLGERLHYAEWKPKESGRTYHLVTVEVTPYLLDTLERAAKGTDGKQLAEALVADDDEITFDEAIEYIDSLIDSQILVPDIGLTVTGPEPIHGMLDKLAAYENDMPALADLRDAKNALQRMDADGIGLDPGRYESAVRRLESLPAHVDVSKLWQVDLHKPVTTATLGTPVLDELATAASLLVRLAWQDSTPMQRFADAFVERYEAQEVPLIEALDEERGVGFDLARGTDADHAPLLEGLAFPPKGEPPSSTWRRYHAHLLRRTTETIQKARRELVLDESDIKTLANDNPDPLPDALAVMARVASPSRDELGKGNFRVLIDNVSGPSGAVLLGRFCHGAPDIEKHVGAHLAQEEEARPDVVYAEIVHLPEGRIGNVLLRPVLRGYEICYLGESGAPPERQIPISDLYVSVEHRRVRLRSKRLDREVIPRLTCAHNYSRRSLGLYRFLCSLQSQGCATGMRWQWGPLTDAPFLPRVVLGRVILSRARWMVYRDEIETLENLTGADLYGRVQSWRQQRSLPRWIVLSDFDNELPLDLDNILAVETLASLLKNRPGAILHEMYPAADEAWVHGPEGEFASQVVVPFMCVEQAKEHSKSCVGKTREVASAVIADQSPFPRRFPMGSPWLTVKLYTGTATADHVLAQMVRPLLRDATSPGAIDRWHFIRYADPHWHLRLRFGGKPRTLRECFLPKLEETIQRWVEGGPVWRAQIDTYVREVERYGGADSMELAEEVFCIDSEAVLAIVETLSGDEGANARWQLALVGVDRILTDFGYDVDGKRALMTGLSDAYLEEFNANSTFRKELGARFREHRALIEAITTDGIDPKHPLAPGIDALSRRSAALAPIARQFVALANADRLVTPLDSVVGSLIHMHVNRILRAKHRAQEVVLYFLLARHYDAAKARKSTERKVLTQS